MKIGSEKGEEERTVAIVDEVIEGVAVTVVSEFVVGSWELLKALKRDRVEVSTEFGVLRKNHASTRNERVDQRSLVLVVPHLLLPDLSHHGFLEMLLFLYPLHNPLFSFSFLFLSLSFLERERASKERERVRIKAGFISFGSL